jgi:hypothetical protein
VVKVGALPREGRRSASQPAWPEPKHLGQRIQAIQGDAEPEAEHDNVKGLCSSPPALRFLGLGHAGSRDAEVEGSPVSDPFLTTWVFWSILRVEVVRGAVAQLGERYNRTVEVRGSSPLSSTRRRA